MLKRLGKSEFSKNVITLMTGTTIGQLLPLALTPVLTRLFSPDEFGLFAFYTSMVTFLMVIAAGRYEQAVVLPKEDKEAINILALCFSILAVITALLFLIYFLAGDLIAGWINKPAIADWLWFVPVSVFFATAYRILTFWSNRKKRFKGTSASVVAQAGGRVSVQLVGGLGKYGVLSGKIPFGKFVKSIWDKSHPEPTGITPLGIGSLILSFAFGFFMGTLMLLFPFLKKDRSLFSAVSWKQMKEQAKVYDKFPKVNTFHALGDEMKNLGVTSTIIYAFSDVILGFYSMTFRVLRAPLSVIGNSFGQVFYQKAAEMHANKQNYVRLIDSTIKKLSLIALPIFLVIVFFGPPLFAWVLGEKWRVAGEYAQYLTPWLFASFVISPIQQVAVIVDKQFQIFLFSILGNVIIFGSILIGGFVFNNILGGFILLSALQTVYFLWIYLWIKRIAKESCKEF
ncbi:MAG: oligosaccharide flippase family protein [Flavobacteriales bacterium]|nr:oligosaccharide flippase family protein [Flavobacteriales bacterium]